MRAIVAIDEGFVPYVEDDVRRVLLDFPRYGEWWGPPFRFDVTSGGAGEVGTRLRVAKGALRWVATVTAVGPERIELSYGDGAWNGEARWSTRSEMGGTAIVFRVDVDPATLWLRLLSWRVDLGRRHSRQMRDVFKALDKRLAALGAQRVPEPQPPEPAPPRPGSVQR
jgi:hypothetical protein